MSSWMKLGQLSWIKILGEKYITLKILRYAQNDSLCIICHPERMWRILGVSVSFRTNVRNPLVWCVVDFSAKASKWRYTQDSSLCSEWQILYRKPPRLRHSPYQGRKISFKILLPARGAVACDWGAANKTLKILRQSLPRTAGLRMTVYKNHNKKTPALETTREPGKALDSVNNRVHRFKHVKYHYVSSRGWI